MQQELTERFFNGIFETLFQKKLLPNMDKNPAVNDDQLACLIEYTPCATRSRSPGQNLELVTTWQQQQQQQPIVSTLNKNELVKGRVIFLSLPLSHSLILSHSLLLTHTHAHTHAHPHAHTHAQIAHTHAHTHARTLP